MAHPAASVKSIFSGKINLDSPDDFYREGDNSTVNVRDGEDNEDNEGAQGNYKGYEYIDDISSKESNYSITSKNLKAFDNQRIKLNDTNGTNLSLVSADSDYQENMTSESASDFLNPEYFALDTPSRPLSRNSTTSCLSTTATKDGIEGRRLHRHGPTAYSSNIISNMMHAQQLQSLTKSRLAKEVNDLELEPSIATDDDVTSSMEMEIDGKRYRNKRQLKKHIQPNYNLDDMETDDGVDNKADSK